MCCCWLPQVEALRLALELGARLPGLVQLLQTQDAYAGGEEAGNDACTALRRSYAVVLRQSVFSAGAWGWDI